MCCIDLKIYIVCIYIYIYANMDDMDTLHYQYGYMDTCEDMDLYEIVRVYLSVISNKINVICTCTHIGT